MIEKIINFLKKKKKWMSSREIAQKLKVKPHNVSGKMGRLYKQGIIFRKIQREEGIPLPVYKLR